ncbi:MAG TPA: ferritin-like domain-containing protein [Polyangia bacterium]|nr:ferritin-like domain-containing protein [Polyangia bacterium]
MSHEGYHEPADLLPEETKDFHRAIESLIEELEAVDWYQQRADATKDESLKAVLLHNRNEEVEHAMMTLEWLRRHDAKIDETARTYLFTDSPITEIEEAKDAEKGAKAGDGGATPDTLGIGGLRSKS